ncbi:MAG: hypothetical protein IT370_31565 [Deltaproteobacteria bacterium]|nr:hypothetical protein [Deltaproteobacteria bacterium]
MGADGMKKLFHAVVVVGAALTAAGCGDDEAGGHKDAAVVVADASVSPDAATVSDAGQPDARGDGMVIIL